MRLLRGCGCSLLPILLLLLGGLVVLNDPHILPGAIGDVATNARSAVGSFVLGGELSSADVALRDVDVDTKNGGTLTVALETKATKAPALKTLAPALKAIGGHVSGPLALSGDATAKVVVVVRRASDDKTLLTLRATVADLVAYAEGKLTSAAFLKKVTVAP